MHRRAQDLATQRGVSLSSVVAELAMRGLAQIDAPVRLATHPATGLPVLSVGRRVTSADVADALDEDA